MRPLAALLGTPAPRALAAGFALLVALVLAEGVLRRLVLGRPWDWRAAAASLADAGVRRGLDLAGIALAAPAPGYAFAHRLATIRMDGVGPWLALLLLVELAYYAHHRLAHRIRWLWATHAVHHSSNELTLAAAARLGWTGRLGGAVLFFAPLVWLGFPPGAVAGTVAAGLLWQFWLHVDWLPRLGALEWILNTPSHHRVHHASNPEYLDCNFGGLLIVYDRLFGTFVAERADVDIRFGLVRPVRSCNPVRIAFHEWWAMARDFLAARGLRARLRVLFGPP